MMRAIKNFWYEITLFMFFVLIRLLGLGYDTFNTDVWKWKARIYDFGSGVFGLNFSQTIQKYHPGVTLMWIGSLAVKAYNLYYRTFFQSLPEDNSVGFIFELHFMQKLFIVVIIGLTFSFILYPLRRLFGRRYAILALLLLSFEPLYLGLTRELHLEGLVSTFMLASFVWLYFYFSRNGKSTCLYSSAIFAALALLTKSSSLFLIPFAALLFFLKSFNDKKISKTFAGFGVWLLTVCLFFFLLWPAMWVVPLQALRTYYRGIFTIGVERGHEQFYFGKLVDDPGISYYFVVFFLKSSVYIIPGFLLTLLLRKKVLNKNSSDFVFYCLLYAIFYFLEITIPSKKLDRYILPSIMSLSLISSFFYVYLINFFSKGLLKKAVFCLFILFFPAVYFVVRIHPDYFSYYSPYAGGLRVGITVLEPKWIIGQKEVTLFFKRYLDNKTLEQFKKGESFSNSKELSKKLTIAFPEKYYTQMWPFIRRIGGWAVIEDLTPEAEKTRFFVYPVWDDFSYKENRFRLVYVGDIKLRGTKLFNVYERKISQTL